MTPVQTLYSQCIYNFSRIIKAIQTSIDPDLAVWMDRLIGHCTGYIHVYCLLIDSTRDCFCFLSACSCKIKFQLRISQHK